MLRAVNPVLARELKERMRGRRAAVIITIYLTLLTLILWLVYEAASSSSEFGNPLPTQLAEIGSTMFEWVLFCMLLILLFLVPAQTAGAIAGERERQTLATLQITLLSPGSILRGKIAAAMAFLVLLVVAAVPLMSIAYLIGGVTVGQVVGGTTLVVASGVCVATLCAAISTFARRVQSATVLSYGLTLALVGGTFLVYGAAAVIDQSRGVDEADPPSAILALNPVAIVGDLVGGTGFEARTSPFDWVKELTDPPPDEGQFRFEGGFDVEDFEGQGVPIGPALDGPVVPTTGGAVIVEDFEGQGVPIAGPPPPFDAPIDIDVLDLGQAPGDGGFPYWAGSLLALGGMAAGSLLLAARRLRTPAERER